MAKWTYWQQPIEGNYRIREEVDGGRNHRIIDFVDTEEEAKRLCDEHNDPVSSPGEPNG
jgi:hypothetical protein